MNISDSFMEPLRAKVQFDVAAGPSLAAGVTRTAFVDEVGGSASGGIVLAKDEASFSNGLVPDGVGFSLFGLSLWWSVAAEASVPTEGAITALGNNVLVELIYQTQEYKLGLVEQYRGPFGPATGANNRSWINPFNPFGVKEGGFIIEPRTQFKLRFATLRSLSAGVAAGTNYVLNIVIPALTMRQGAAAGKGLRR